jgi:hypothetical protein
LRNSGWPLGGRHSEQSAAFAGTLLTLLRRAEAIGRGSAARATEQRSANMLSADDKEVR